jgi:hypothetical protein
MMAKTGRQIIMERLYAAIRKATTADLQRAAMFLEWAFDVRKGCARQRAAARQAQSEAWKKNVDAPARW